MHQFRRLIALFLLALTSSNGYAVEGPAAAGPIGGTDMRSAMLPPPGLYSGAVLLATGTTDFVDGDGDSIPALSTARLTKEIVAPFLYFVPESKLLGGSIGFGAMVPVGNQCGHLFIGESDRCSAGLGDPYVELNWSRSFGTLRASDYPGAYPILEGLSVMLGLGVVIPAGSYEASTPTKQALSIGANIWDVAPSVAVTYTTPPIIAEGTEFSAKVYWNNYLRNPETHYLTGDVIGLDFAITEHVGRFQFGVIGAYGVQIGDDEIFGAPVPPDGRRAKLLQMGGVVAYDMPEYGATMKLKANTNVLAEDLPPFWAVVFGWIKKY